MEHMARYDTTITILLYICTTDIHFSESDVVSVLLGRGWGLGLLGRVCAQVCVCVGGVLNGANDFTYIHDFTVGSGASYN